MSSSHGAESATICTPPCSQAGRGPGEGVLEHPLAERLARHGGVVVDARAAAGPSRGRAATASGRRGRPSCTGSGRARRPSRPAALPPRRRQARAEVVHEPLEHAAVARQVVARDHRDPAGLPARHARLEAAGELAERRGGRPAGQVGADRVVVGEAARAVARVAALRDGERDDVHGGIRDPRGRLVAGHDVAQEREHLGACRRPAGAPRRRRGRPGGRARRWPRGAAAPRRRCPTGPGACSSARTVCSAWCARANAPMPRWTMPTGGRSSSAGRVPSPAPRTAAGASRGTAVLPPSPIAGTVPVDAWWRLARAVV